MPLKRLIGGLVAVSAAILVVPVARHPAIAARASAASAIDSGSSGTSTSTACCTSDGTSPSPPDRTPSTGKGVPIVLVSGTSGGLSLAGLLVLWAFTSHARKVRRHVRWVNEHLRVVAGSSLDLPRRRFAPGQARGRYRSGWNGMMIICEIRRLRKIRGWHDDDGHHTDRPHGSHFPARQRDPG